MHENKPSMRMCCGCGEMFPKTELVRIVRSPDGIVSLDLTGRKAGRGAYLCKNAECLRKARKTGRPARALQCTIADEVYQNMELEIG